MGIPESSSLPIVRDRVSEVSQSGLTQELGFVVVGLELEVEAEFLSMEDLTEREWRGLVVANMEMGFRSGDERMEREEEKDRERNIWRERERES